MAIGALENNQTAEAAMRIPRWEKEYRMGWIELPGFLKTAKEERNNEIDERRKAINDMSFRKYPKLATAVIMLKNCQTPNSVHVVIDSAAVTMTDKKKHEEKDPTQHFFDQDK